MAIPDKDPAAVKLADRAAATGAQASVTVNGGPAAPNRTFQAVARATGAVTATVLIQVSLDNVNWITLGTITLSGTNTATDGFASNAAWLFYRANITALTGTAPAVDVLMNS